MAISQLLTHTKVYNKFRQFKRFIALCRHFLIFLAKTATNDMKKRNMWRPGLITLLKLLPSTRDPVECYLCIRAHIYIYIYANAHMYLYILKAAVASLGQSI